MPKLYFSSRRIGFRQSAEVPFAIREPGIQESLHQLCRGFDACDPSAQTNHIHVVVLHPLVRRKMIGN